MIYKDRECASTLTQAQTHTHNTHITECWTLSTINKLNPVWRRICLNQALIFYSLLCSSDAFVECNYSSLWCCFIWWYMINVSAGQLFYLSVKWCHICEQHVVDEQQSWVCGLYLWTSWLNLNWLLFFFSVAVGSCLELPVRLGSDGQVAITHLIVPNTWRNMILPVAVGLSGQTVEKMQRTFWWCCTYTATSLMEAVWLGEAAFPSLKKEIK